MKEYTERETAAHKQANADRSRASKLQISFRKIGQVIWDSDKKSTFRGSIREQFTGQKRCGISA